MSLVEHAKQEFAVLEWPGDDDVQEAICNNVIDLLEAISKQGHSGFSAPYMLSLLDKLARFEPLSPLTGDDSEWAEVENNTWQNKRCCEVFKDESGAYWIEGKIFKDKNGATYTSRDSRVYIKFPWVKPNPVIIEEDKQDSLFLSELVDHARTYGWDGHGDYEEVWKFVEWCHQVANKPLPEDNEPYANDPDPLGLK